MAAVDGPTHLQPAAPSAPTASLCHLLPSRDLGLQHRHCRESPCLPAEREPAQTVISVRFQRGEERSGTTGPGSNHQGCQPDSSQLTRAGGRLRDHQVSLQVQTGKPRDGRGAGHGRPAGRGQSWDENPAVPLREPVTVSYNTCLKSLWFYSGRNKPNTQRSVHRARRPDLPNKLQTVPLTSERQTGSTARNSAVLTRAGPQFWDVRGLMETAGSVCPRRCPFLVHLNQSRPGGHSSASPKGR